MVSHLDARRRQSERMLYSSDVPRMPSFKSGRQWTSRKSTLCSRFVARGRYPFPFAIHRVSHGVHELQSLNAFGYVKLLAHRDVVMGVGN